MASVDGYTYILVFWHKYNKLWAPYHHITLETGSPTTG